MTEELINDLRIEIYKMGLSLEKQLSEIRKLMMPISLYFKLKMEKEFKEEKNGSLF